MAERGRRAIGRARSRFSARRRYPGDGHRESSDGRKITAGLGAAEPNLLVPAATLREYDTGLAEDRSDGAARMRAADRLVPGTYGEREERAPSAERRSARDRCQRGVASASEDGSMCDKRVIGYWVPEKKRQKFNWTDFENICESEGFRLKMVSGCLPPARLVYSIS